jgi:hypothetical protein
LTLLETQLVTAALPAESWLLVTPSVAANAYTLEKTTPPSTAATTKRFRSAGRRDRVSA